MVCIFVNLCDSFAFEKWKKRCLFVVAVSIHWVKLLELLKSASIEWNFATVITNTPWCYNQSFYWKSHFDAVIIALLRYSKLTWKKSRGVVSSKMSEELIVYFLSKYDEKNCALH